MNFNIIFNNPNNCYYGHGTRDNIDVINSIFDNGLRCSHNSMYFTTCNLGFGGEIEDEISEMMNNWPHLEADKIIIISLPKKFHILDVIDLGTYNQATNAFCCNVENTENLADGKYVMAEFILGCYDAKTKTFEKNNKYYEFLTKEEQEKLFNKVKENYVQTIEDACGLDYYKELLTHLPEWPFPLTDEECNSLVKNDNTPRINL